MTKVHHLEADRVDARLNKRRMVTIVACAVTIGAGALIAAYHDGGGGESPQITPVEVPTTTQLPTVQPIPISTPLNP